jgi:hypothetical protein
MVRNSVQSNSKQPAPANDSDLADLLDENGNTSRGSSDGANRKPGNIEMAALNLDHLTQGKLDMSNKGSYRPFPSVRQIPFLDYLSSYLSMLCYYYPVMCGLFFFFAVSTTMVLIGNLVLNPTEEFGIIKHDHSNIQSKYDLSMGEIDHWCLGGGNEKCKCEDPLVPVSRAERKSWVQAFKGNRKLVKQYQDDAEGTDKVDVAFLGESVIEEMAGRWLGQQRSMELKSVETMFLNNFDKRRGARMQGVALGIAGDSSPTVLWRLMHGEMPKNFNPKVWWVSLGNNDLDRMKCSEEVVVLGILRVIEEILENKPDAQIVINSLFPMSKSRGGEYPLTNDFKDSLNQNKAGSSRAVQSAPISNFENRRSAGMQGVNGNLNPNAPLPRTTSSRSSSASPPRPLNNGGGFDFPGTRRNLRFKSREYANPLPPRKQPQTESSMAEEAEKEEAVRDKVYHKKHDKRFQPRERKSSDALGDSNKHMIRKYNARRGFMAKNRIPLWTSIQAINDQLRKFAASHERVTYFDANELFTITDSPDVRRGVAILNRSRMTPRGHPTEMGYSLWEDAILKRLDRLFEVMKRDRPELFYKKGLDDDDIKGWVGDADDIEEDDDYDEDAFDNSITDDIYNSGYPSGYKGSTTGTQDKVSAENQGGSVDGFAFADKGAPMGNRGGTGDGITSGSTRADGPSAVTGTPLNNGQMYGQRGGAIVRESTTPGAAGGAVARGYTEPVPAVNTGSRYGALGGAPVNPKPVPAGGALARGYTETVPAVNRGSRYGALGGAGALVNPNPVPAANRMFDPFGDAAAGTEKNSDRFDAPANAVDDNGANVGEAQVYDDYGDGN